LVYTLRHDQHLTTSEKQQKECAKIIRSSRLAYSTKTKPKKNSLSKTQRKNHSKLGITWARKRARGENNGPLPAAFFFLFVETRA
jgi:hypothetical protein